MTQHEQPPIEEVFSLKRASLADVDQLVAVLQSVGWPLSEQDAAGDVTDFETYFLIPRQQNHADNPDVGEQVKIGAAATVALRDQVASVCVVNVATKPTFQRRGLATWLLQHLIEKEKEMIRRTGRPPRSFTLNSSDVGQGLYRSLGFRGAKIHLSQYRLPVDQPLPKDIDQEEQRLLGLLKDRVSSWSDVPAPIEDIEQMAQLSIDSTGGQDRKRHIEIYSKSHDPLGQPWVLPPHMVALRGSDNDLQKDGSDKIVAFGGVTPHLQSDFIGPIIAPTVEMAQLLLLILTRFRDTEGRGRACRVLVIDELDKGGQITNWLAKLGFHSADAEESKQTETQDADDSNLTMELKLGNDKSIFDGYLANVNAGRVKEYCVVHPGAL